MKQPTADDAERSQDGRFSRFELISWWSQERLERARVLVVGAGALGNEILKNLALLGFQQVVLIDFDLVERSNLSRSVLFRESDEGQPKVEAAARGAREIYPLLRVRPLSANVVHDIGLGLFRWANVVLGALDNREARLAINRACYRTGTPWIDGAIEVLSGVARLFAPDGPCYECTMNENDWEQLATRRSCSLLNRELVAHGRTPTSPTTAAVIAAIQCQETLKLLHGLETLEGAGYVFDGLGHSSYVVRYQRNPDCLSHDPLPELLAVGSAATTSAADLLELAADRLGGSATLQFSRELAASLDCPDCGDQESVLCSLSELTEQRGACPHCGARRAPRLFHSLSADEPELAARPLVEIGIPPWDIIEARTTGDRRLAFELAGDRDAVLGPMAQEPEEVHNAG
ncbi:ThiF family adenylyltransferase [bacterium AH-315-M10]|nr:ThiF family adenylyltransferase [bacterium AH-315-M10]